MNVTELDKDPEMKKFIDGIVRHRLFIVLKDAFVSHTPAGEAEANRSQTEDPLVLHHGKYLGTRYVFNEMEKIANTKQAPNKKEAPKGEGDPDLAT